MATIDSAAICAAVVGRLKGTALGIRLPPTGTFTTGIYASLVAEEQARRALVEPRFDAYITAQSGRAVIGERGGTQYLTLRIAVRTIYALTETAKASESALDAVRAQGTANLDAIRQALMFPEPDTSNPGPMRLAGIASGCMREQVSAALVRESFAERRVEFMSEFACTVAVSPATS